MKLAWVSDPHLNFLSSLSIQDFCRYLNDYDSDGIVITGDIAEAPTIEKMLETLAVNVHKPIYFVLGNHDFYHGSVEDVHPAVSKLAKKFDNLHYLTDSGMIELTPNTVMIGHNGWYDCKSGSFITSPFVLNDFSLIDEYKYTNRSKEEIFRISNEITMDALQHFGYYLREGFKDYDEIIMVTHVPPFVRMCTYKNEPTETNALPFFSCSSLGDMIIAVKDKFPDKTLTILAGHTHYAATFNFDKIYGYVADAEYGEPKVYQTLTVNR